MLYFEAKILDGRSLGFCLGLQVGIIAPIGGEHFIHRFADKIDWHECGSYIVEAHRPFVIIVIEQIIQYQSSLPLLLKSYLHSNLFDFLQALLGDFSLLIISPFPPRVSLTGILVTINAGDKNPLHDTAPYIYYTKNAAHPGGILCICKVPAIF